MALLKKSHCLYCISSFPACQNLYIASLSATSSTVKSAESEGPSIDLLQNLPFL